MKLYSKKFYNDEIVRIEIEEDYDIETGIKDRWIESITMSNSNGESVEISSFLELLPDSLNEKVYQFLYTLGDD